MKGARGASRTCGGGMAIESADKLMDELGERGGLANDVC